MKKDKATFIIEGEIPENMHYELSKKIDEIAKSFGLESYLDDVCEHNNTITNECSDCNENELSDYYQDQSIDDGKTDRLVGAILSRILPEIRNLVIEYGLRDRIYEIVGEWSKVDFDKLSNSDIDDSIMEQIFKNLSMCAFVDFINTYKKEEE